MLPAQNVCDLVIIAIIVTTVAFVWFAGRGRSHPTHNSDARVDITRIPIDTTRPIKKITIIGDTRATNQSPLSGGVEVFVRTSTGAPLGAEFVKINNIYREGADGSIACTQFVLSIATTLSAIDLHVRGGSRNTSIRSATIILKDARDDVIMSRKLMNDDVPDPSPGGSI